MSLPSRSIRPRRHSLVWAMALIAVIAADLAALRPYFPLQMIGLFRMVSRKGGDRTFWLGFEIAGWPCVILCSVFAQTIWWQARSVFEGYLLARQIGRPLDMGRFVLFTGGLHFAISLAIALFIGILARSAWRRWAQESMPLACRCAR